MSAIRENAAVNAERHGTASYGPMVCQCPAPDADPHRDGGMCQNRGCKRKPLSLMKAAS